MRGRTQLNLFHILALGMVLFTIIGISVVFFNRDSFASTVWVATIVIFITLVILTVFLFIFTSRLISQKEQAEKQARDAAKRFQIFFDASPAFIEIWDENFDPIECNQRTAELFGLSDKMDFIKRYAEFSPEYQPCGASSDEKWVEMAEKALKEGTVTFEWMHLTSDGKPFPVEATFVRLENDGKTVIMGYNHDLRPMKAAIESEQSNKAKSMFLARMSHEIRTPIAAVLGISEVQLRNKVMPPQTEEAFIKIYDSSKTLLNIVNDILDFSRIESGKLPLINNEYDVASLISDTSQLHLIYLERKNVLFRIHVDKNLPTKLIGDALRIRQIINNLTTNAFKYTETGTVVLSLSCEREKENKVTLVISIKDTGIGMTAEQIDEIKGEYIRLREHEKSFVTGTGLGLPIVYSLAQMMGAQVELTSKVRAGTHALVRIPQKVSGTQVLGQELANSLQNFESSTWSMPKELTFVPEKIPHGNVLVVDDVDTNLYVAEAMLESFGLSIELCENGQDAINKIRQGNAYDIIFMDHMMPGMDGIEVTKTLRNMGYSHPIVALTANALKGQAEMFIDNGFSGFMSKPMDIKLLNSYLVRFIKNKHEAT